MNVCYLPTYEPGYSRVKILKEGLEKNGVKIIDCSSSINIKKENSFLRYLHVIGKYLKNKKQCDVVLIGFWGHPLVPLVRLLTKKTIILDAFMSLYNTLVEDKKKVKKGSFLAKIVFKFEKWVFNNADIVILDTNEHIRYCEKLYGINGKKFRRILIGADDNIFFPKKAAKKPHSGLVVTFHGRYIPLQGTDTIIKAAYILRKENIKFQLIGSGQTFNQTEALARKLKLQNVFFIKTIPVTEVSQKISESDICLGIFGDTLKTRLVIPNKVYEIMAMKKPLITADTLAAREVLQNKQNAVLCRQADAKSLAESIMLLKQNKALRNKIAINGYNTFKSRCSPKAIGVELKRIVIEGY